MPYPNQQRTPGRIFGNQQQAAPMPNYQTPASMPPPVSMNQQVMRPQSPMGDGMSPQMPMGNPMPPMMPQMPMQQPPMDYRGIGSQANTRNTKR